MLSWLPCHLTWLQSNLSICVVFVVTHDVCMDMCVLRVCACVVLVDVVYMYGYVCDVCDDVMCGVYCVLCVLRVCECSVGK